MIVLDFEQGSPEWFAARCGIPTASKFDKIIAEDRHANKPKDWDDAWPWPYRASASMFFYMCRLLAERSLGESYEDDTAKSGYIRRGRDMEAKALAWYTFQTNQSIRRVGLCLRDDHLAGCSPDGLIGDDGGIEVKVPGAEKHWAYMIRPELLIADYQHQVQGGLYVTGRKWWDLVSYNPAIDPVVVRVEPEPDYQTALDVGIRQLNADIEKYLIQFGYVQAEAA